MDVIAQRLSRRGRRKLDNAIHMVALTRIRNPSHQWTDRLRVQDREGKIKREALRSLRRQIANAIYSQLVLDA